jgi:LytS/YehU family sensor histidine kinase
VSNSNPKAWVNISVKLEGKMCIYEVENSKIISPKPEAEEKSGIGLNNLKRRLELSYPGRYDLEIQNLADRYFVKLKIDLS